WFDGYRVVNAAIAERALAIGRQLPRRPLFLTQDYQLYLAPELIRSALPDAAMQHFIHVPWPEPRYMKVLPAVIREAIFKGLLSHDIVDLQTTRFAGFGPTSDCCKTTPNITVASPCGPFYSRPDKTSRPTSSIWFWCAQPWTASIPDSEREPGSPPASISERIFIAHSPHTGPMTSCS